MSETSVRFDDEIRQGDRYEFVFSAREKEGGPLIDFAAWSAAGQIREHPSDEDPLATHTITLESYIDEETEEETPDAQWRCVLTPTVTRPFPAGRHLVYGIELTPPSGSAYSRTFIHGTYKILPELVR